MRILLILCVVAVVGGCGKADIEAQCTLNGFGAGSCSFTNTGNGKGAICGKIVLTRTDGGEARGESNRFCSGQVEQSSTTKVEFSMPDVRDVCDHTSDQKWTQVCEFEFRRDDG